MNDKEAIEYIEQFIGIKKEYKCKPIKVKTLNNTREAIETILKLIEKQQYIIEGKECVIETQAHNEEVLNKIIDKKQAEIKKKDKIIDLMAEKLVKAHEWFYSEFDNYTKEDFIKYFERKVEEE